MKLQRLLGALAAGLMLFSLPARATEQSTTVMPIVGPMSMATFAGKVNDSHRAMMSCSWGPSAPANGPSGAPIAYQCWADTTANPVLFKRYDGASWVITGSLNTSTHVWLPYLTGGVSGGVPYFSATNIMGSSALLAQYGFMVGGGAGAAPATIAACTDDQIAFGRSSNSPLCRTVTGDISFASGVSAVGAAKITSAMLRNSGALSVIGRSANSGGVPADISASAASDAVMRESGSVLGFGTIATGGIANNAVTDAKLRQSGALALVGRSANSTGNVADIQAVAASSCAFRESGSTIACGTLATAAYAANSVTNAKLAQMAAYTFKCNSTGSTADPVDCTIAGLTHKSSPASTDRVMISDGAASDATKYSTVSELVGALASGVSSYNTRTGAVVGLFNDVPVMNYIAGLTLSTAGSSSTFGIAAGVATNSTNVSMMSLGSAYTKTTSAWSVGSGNGAMDTGSVANSTWYHVHLIQRPDTGVVDVLFSLSATSPTLPTNYTLSRRIGSMKTNGSAQWVRFVQLGDSFLWSAPANDVTGSTFSTSTVSLTVQTPLGVQTDAILAQFIDASTNVKTYLWSPDVTTVNLEVISFFGAAGWASGTATVRTNTSSQVNRKESISGGGSTTIETRGYIDTRGKG